MIDLTHAIAAARVDARRWLELELDRLCTRNGLDPYEAWRKPARLETLERVNVASATIRRQAQRVQHDNGGPMLGGYLPLKVEPVGEGFVMVRPRRDDRGRFLPRVNP